MRSTTYISFLTAALSWSAHGAILDKTLKHGSHAVHKLAGGDAGSRTLNSDGSHPKNSSSVTYRKQQGIHLEIRQAGGSCGASAGRCPDNLCCSDYGFCGDSVDHCAPLLNCQTQYGVCGWPRVIATTPRTTASPPTTAAPPTTSTTSTPPVVVVTTPPPVVVTTPPPVVITTPSTTTTPRISTAISSLTPPTRLPPTSTAIPALGTITTNGMCGNGTTCLGNPSVGPCCSQFFYCGSSLEYCGAGCHAEFGACLGVQGLPPNLGANSTVTSGGSVVVVQPTTVLVPTTVTVTSTVVGPAGSAVTVTVTAAGSSVVVVVPPTTTSTTSTTPVVVTVPPSTSSTSTTTSARPTTTAVQLPAGQRSSTDGRCGSGVSCLGTSYGRCCSQFGWCGDGDQFCPPVVGCQPQFGTCDSA